MARREDDSYTNASVFETSVEDGRKDKSESYAVDEPPQPVDDALCGMSTSVSFIQQVITEDHLVSHRMHSLDLDFSACCAWFCHASSSLPSSWQRSS
jgi:hypothetical protein